MNGLVDDLQRAVDLLDRTYATYRGTLAMCANKFGPNVTFDATNATAALAVLDDLKRIAVRDQGDAIGDSRHAVMQVDLPRGDVHIFAGEVMEAVAACEPGEYQAGEQNLPQTCGVCGERAAAQQGKVQKLATLWPALVLRDAAGPALEPALPLPASSAPPGRGPASSPRRTPRCCLRAAPGC